MENDPKTTILNVDDDDAGRYAISRTLRQAGFDVKEASNGKEALRFAEEQPDLILLDVNLPDINGFDVCRMIKNNPLTSRIPVLHISATYLDDESKVKGLETADGYLTQPVEPPVLIATVKALLRMKRAEEAVRESLNRWQTTFDGIKDSIFLLDKEGVIFQINKNAAKLFGKTEKEIQGHHWWEIVHGTSEPIAGCPIVRMKQSKQRETMLLPVDDKWYEVTVDPLLNQDSNLLGAVHIISDITERKRAEEALRQAEENFRRSLEDSPLGVRIVSEEGETIYANRIILQIYGYDSVEELRTTPVKERYTPESYAGFQIRKEKRQRGEDDPSEYEISIVRKSGEIRHLQVFRKEVLWNGERQFQTIYHDITERKRAEVTLRRSEERFHTSVETLLEGFAILSSIRDSDGQLIDFRYEYINEIGCKMNQKAREEHIGRTLLKLFPEEKEIGLFDDYVEVIETGQPLVKEHVIYEPVYGGSDRLKQAFDVRISRLEDGIVVTWQDITEKKRREELLRQSEERLKRLVENSKDIIVMADLDGEVLYYNGPPGYGLRTEDILGKNAFSIFEPVIAARLMNQLRRVVREKEALTIENLIPWRGESFWFLTHIYPIKDEKDHMIAVGIIALDITERKRSEEVLRRSEASYRELADSITDVFFAFDKDLRYTYWNKASEELTGIPTKDAIGKSFYELFPDTTDTRRAERVYLDVLRTQQPQSFVNEYQHGGKDFFFEISAYLSMSGLSVFVKDITERKQMEEVLQFTRFSLDNAADTMVCVDHDGRFIDVNDAFCRSMGYSREELRSMSVHDIDPNYPTEIWPEFWEKLKQGGSLTFESCHRTKEGKVFPVEITANFLEYNGKEYHCSFARDITKRKHAEEALRESEVRYRNLVESISDVVYAIDSSGMLTYISPVVKNTLEYEPDELIGRQFLEFVHKEDHDLLMRRLSELREGIVRHSDYRVIGKHGDIKWVRTLTNPIIEEGGFVGARGVLIDITERKRAEEKLLRQSALLTGINKIFREALLCQTEEELGRTCLAVAEQLTGSKFGFIDEINQAGRLDTIALSNPGWDACRLPKSGAPLLLKDMEIRGIPGRVIKDGQTEIANEPASHPAWVGIPEGHPPVASFIGIPLKHMNNTIGIIGLANKETGYGTADQETMEALSVVIVEALERKRAEEALRESESKLRSLFENMTEGVSLHEVIYDESNSAIDYRILSVNPAYQKHTGIKPERIHGQLASNAYGTGKAPYLETYALVASSGRPCFFETFFSPMGRYFHISVSSPKKGHFVTIFEDITERKQAEEALKKSTQLLRDTGEMAKVGGWELDLSTKEVSWTEEVGRIHGVEPGYKPKLEEAIKFYAPESIPALKAALKKTTETGEPYDLESLFIPSGSKDKIWVRSLGRAVYSGGKIVKLTGTFQNIDKYKRAGEALRVSLEKYRVLFESFPLGITISDKSGKIIEGNRQSEQLLGIAREAHAQRRIDSKEWQIIRKDGTPMPADEYASTRALGENRLIENVEMGIVKDKGEITWISVTAAPIPLEGYGVAIAYGDITERKQAEEQLKSSHEQLRALSTHLQNIREEERTLISREIHDELGQELTGLKMDISWLVKRLSKNQKSLISKTESMLKLVDSTIQTVRRISSKLRPGVLDDLGLIAAIEWQAQDFENRTGITCDFSSSVEEIDLDRDRSTAVFRIFQETLTNVSRHAKATRVKINLEESADFLILRIEDNGKGIKESEVSHRESLGLLGMRERVLVFGGEVEISGIPKKGTSVVLKIPLER